MKKFFSDNWIMLVTGFAFIVSTVFAIRNNYTIDQNHALLQETALVRQYTEQILNQTMHGIDLGVRGYGLTLDEKLLSPYHEAIGLNTRLFQQLDSLLTKQGYAQRDKLSDMKREVDQYIKFSDGMILQAKSGNNEAFSAMLKEDRGYAVWMKYTDFSEPLLKYEDKLNEASLKGYQRAIKSNLFLQIGMLILIMPMLYAFVSKVKKERIRRKAILDEVDQTDRSYVFNAGEETASLSEDVNKRSMSNIKQACEFIAAIAQGDYAIEWKGLTTKNHVLNSHTLTGNLILLRDRLRIAKQEDEQRNWVNEGIARFSEMVRNYQNNPEELYLKSISYLTKYINAQQGSLFVIEGEGNDRYLNLVACYAFDKKKWIEKRIPLGNGLVGQAFLEGETIKLKELPKNYIHITTGLGNATPACLVIIPLKYDMQTTAVAEFASWKEIQDYQISFLQKAGEFLASAIASSRITQKMKTLLEEGSIREEGMRQREEELRQNMEELQAIQEELSRKQGL